MPENKNFRKKDRINRDKIEEEYGLAYALFKAFPELNKMLRKAIAQSWTPARFQVELRQTEWFKKHSDTWRQMTALKYSDPKTYNQRIQQSSSSVANLAGAFGVRISDEAIERLGERALLLGWDEGQIRDVLAKHVRPGKAGHYSGQLAGIEQQLRATALNNGVRIGGPQMQKWMRQIVRGNADVAQYDTYVRSVAAKTFEAFATQIEGGMNVADIASPYVQSMSEILELNPGSVNMFDRTIRKALSNKDDKGQPAAMSITDFEDSLRKDKRWQYTENARDVAKGFTAAVSDMWGLS